jgi:tetratricopeptide (TPR) repeat protein
MYTRVAAELENVPRMDDYQRTILEKARQFYENDALLQSRDHATRLDAAVTQLRLAYIDQKLGRIDDARDIAGRALELYESMIREKPAGLEQRAGSAEARASLGHIDLQARKFQSSADQFAMAIDQWENLAQTYPAEPSYRLKLGVSLGELGQALLNCHRLDEANKVYGKSLERLEALAVEHPHREDYRRALAAALDNLASLYTEENRDTESEQLRRRALALRRAIENPNSDNVSSRCDIAWGLNNLGYTLVRLQKVAEADVVLSEAITLCERINSDHPDLPKNRIELSKALCHRGTLHRDTDPSKALEFLRRALVIVREVPLNSPDTPQIQSHLAVILYELAFTERAVTLLENRQDTFNDAEGHLREALTTCDQLAKDSNDVAILDLRGQAWLLRGMMSRDRGRIDEALSSFLIAAESHESLVRKVPNEPQFRGHLTIALGEGLGKTYRQLERKAEALASYRRAVQLLGSIEHKDGTDLYNLACSLAQCSALGTQPGAAASNMSPANDAASAVDAFRLAIAAKACTYADVQDDTDLDPLRGRPDFEALVKELVVDRPAASRSGRPGIGTQQGPK